LGPTARRAEPPGRDLGSEVGRAGPAGAGSHRPRWLRRGAPAAVSSPHLAPRRRARLAAGESGRGPSFKFESAPGPAAAAHRGTRREVRVVIPRGPSESLLPGRRSALSQPGRRLCSRVWQDSEAHRNRRRAPRSESPGAARPGPTRIPYDPARQGRATGRRVVGPGLGRARPTPAGRPAEFTESDLRGRRERHWPLPGVT
jgi:hypothetical protein